MANRVVGLLALATAMASPLAQAAERAPEQKYPVRPVRLVVTVPPGGAADFVARVVGLKLAESLGQTFVVDNRSGGGGHIAGDLVAKSAPDGYTLLLGSSTTHGIGPHLYSKLPYDPMRDLAPVTLLATMPMIMVVNAQLPVQSVKDLIALAKTKPGGLSFGSAGTGTPPHLVGEMFKAAAGAPLVHVPYKGSGPAAVDLAGGQVHVMFDAIAPHLPHIKSGRTKVLAAISPKRLPVAPDAPTMAEVGLPGVGGVIWYGIMAPAGTPKGVVTRLDAEANRIVRMPEVIDRMTGVGVDAAGSTPQSFTKFIRDEFEKWGPAVKASGAKLD
jgi:tripartite-type tricarboxylate transporter receptor subunit TctC